jgi:hypothetical protein
MSFNSLKKQAKIMSSEPTNAKIGKGVKDPNSANGLLWVKEMAT